MRHHPYRWAALAALLVLFPHRSSLAQSIRTATLSKQYRDQPALEARVEFASGTLHIFPGSPASLYRMELLYDEERYLPLSRFDGGRNAVVLGVEATGQGGLRVSSKEHLAQEAGIQFSPRPLLSLMLSLGAVAADVELGGLRLNDLRLETAASRTRIRFSAPNLVQCDLMDLSAGAADFTVEKLGNSRCRQIRFAGGVGDVNLDLTGAWDQDAALSIRVAVGELTLRLTRGTGIELTLDRFLSSFRPSGFIRDDRVYRTEGFEQAARKLRIKLTSTVGGVNVEWAE